MTTTATASKIVAKYGGDIPTAAKHCTEEAKRATTKWLKANPEVLDRPGERCEAAVYWLDVRNEIEGRGVAV